MSTDHNFWRERRAEADSNRGPSDYQHNVLPLGQTGSQRCLDDDDDVEFHVLGCLVDILGTNCDQCLSIVQCCFTSTETIRLIRMESPGRPPRLSHSSWTLSVASMTPGTFIPSVKGGRLGVMEMGMGPLCRQGSFCSETEAVLWWLTRQFGSRGRGF